MIIKFHLLLSFKFAYNYSGHVELFRESFSPGPLTKYLVFIQSTSPRASCEETKIINTEIDVVSFGFCLW